MTKTLDQTPKYTMKVTSDLTGVEPYRIRFWQAKGLIIPSRSDGNQRLYSDYDIERIKVIKELNERYPISAIRQLVDEHRVKGLKPLSV